MTRRIFVGGAGALVTTVAIQAADADLRLRLTMERTQFRMSDPILVAWTLENVSSRPLSVIAFHSAGGGPEYDELNISISRNNGPVQQVSLIGPRAASQIVWKELAPKDKLQQQFNLIRAMELSGLRTQTGSYVLNAEYALSGRTDDQGHPAWSGRVAASQVSFAIS